jgi:aryl-alcohol dehydrogenase-like predicted oxidoreductase
MLTVAIVAYSPLCRGFLAALDTMETLGQNDRRRTHPRFIGPAYEENKRRVERFFKLAASKGCTASQLALAWVHAQGEDVFPIPGTKSSQRTVENAHALQVLASLSAEDINHIAECAEVLEGGRYPDGSINLAFNARM